jgi:hypothetical protein
MDAVPLVFEIKIGKNSLEQSRYLSINPEKGVDLTKKLAELEHFELCCQKWNDI